MDGLLLIMAVVTFAVSQYLFELAVPVVVSLSQENSYQSIYVDEYYTLSTCYLTYSNKVRLVFANSTACGVDSLRAMELSIKPHYNWF